MGNIATLAKRRGLVVSGSDERVYPPMSDYLHEAGIAYYEGYDAARLASLKPDLVIVGNAFSRGNPEIEWLLAERPIPFVSLPEFIGREVIGSRPALVVAGTHGKTTTTALAVHLLKSAGMTPGYLIGGIPRGLPSGAEDGLTGSPFVIEGDEYDSAFFDKRSKFIHYRPRVAVINTIEFDHADIFADFKDVLRTFHHFVRLVPANGFLVVNGDEPASREVADVNWTQVITVGTEAGNDLRISGFTEDGEGSSFALQWGHQTWASIRWPFHGLYNARNAAMAAIGSALLIQPAKPTAVSLAALPEFAGVARRQELLGEKNRWRLVEDFGHHPTAIAGVLRSIRQSHPQDHLVAVLEPRSNTLRTNRLAGPLEEALAGADTVSIGRIDRVEKLSPGDRLDSEALAGNLESKGRRARAFQDNLLLLEDLVGFLESHPGPGTVVFFSNGSFDGLMGRMKAWAQSPAQGWSTASREAPTNP